MEDLKVTDRRVSALPPQNIPEEKNPNAIVMMAMQKKL
jgi:hypothetical protein